MGTIWIILLSIYLVMLAWSWFGKPIIVKKSKLVPPGAIAWAFAPFILFKDERYADETTINHELIHIEQEKELLLIPFYILYVANFIINIFRGTNLPYRNIMFEREAYQNEDNLDYLKTRKRYNYFKLF